MKWNIIEYKNEYRKKVIALWIEICVKEFGFEDWQEDIKEMDNDIYKYNNGNFWIAINNDNEVVGTIALRNLGNGKACLKSLYVKRKYRKNGIAKALFDKLMEFTILNNYKKIELDTYETFKHAIKFYQENEFIIKEHIGSKYIMERDV